MTKKRVHQWLTDFAKFRERKNKNKYIGALVLREHGIEMTHETKSKIGDIVGDILSADRAYRMVLEENPELRGSDYEDKNKLEQQWMLDNEYSVGYYKDIKK